MSKTDEIVKGLEDQVKAERESLALAGGPAFPKSTDYTVTGVDDGSIGMTLRDYFAAHAPPEPQFWFDPKMPSKRPDPIFDDRGINVCAANTSDIEAWDRAKNVARLIQWPYAWADAMLTQRKPAPIIVGEGRAAS